MKRSILTGPPQDTFSYIVHEIIVTIGIGTGSGEFSKTNSVPCTPNTWELRSGLDGFVSNSVFFFRSHHEKDGDSQVYSFVHYSCLGLAPNLERIDFDDISMATSGT